jgi:hypothetical protein
VIVEISQLSFHVFVCAFPQRYLHFSVGVFPFFFHCLYNRELKEVNHFKYLGNVLRRDSYCTREIKMRISIAKEAFNRKISLSASKLNIEPRKKLVRCYVWSIALYTKTWTLRKFGVH